MQPEFEPTLSDHYGCTHNSKSKHSTRCHSSIIWVMLALVLGLSACSDDEADSNAEQATEKVEQIAEANQQAAQQLAAQQQAAATLDFSKDSTSHIYIGTGSVQGVYFPIGGVICRLFNRHTVNHNIRCTLESTGGSINNLVQLRDGGFDIVVAQSDWHYHAYNGTSAFEKYGPNSELRSVFALEADPLALFVKKDSPIATFEDLADRIVSFGYSRSLQHRIMDHYLELKGWTEEKFQQMVLMSDLKQGSALCAGQVDAILFLSSSINDSLANIPEDCELKLVPLNDETVAQVIAKYPYYRLGKIPSSMTRGSVGEVDSFGLGATFVALESTSPKAVYNVVKEIVENFDDFKSLHPSLQMMKADELPKAGLTAPLHPGAIRYYQEARLLR